MSDDSLMRDYRTACDHEEMRKIVGCMIFRSGYDTSEDMRHIVSGALKTEEVIKALQEVVKRRIVSHMEAERSAVVQRLSHLEHNLQEVRDDPAPEPKQATRKVKVKI